jgi:uncharacterized protein YndB with AHSA1/START domain
VYSKEVAIHIDAPPEAVYDYVSDLSRHQEWAKTKIDLTIGPAGDSGLPTFTSVAHAPGSPRAQGKVLTADRPGRFQYEAKDSSGRYLWTFAITPESGGSRLVYRMEQQEVPILFRLMQPFVFGVVGRTMMADSLTSIKAKVEAQPAS